jgi:hypothetical protein
MRGEQSKFAEVSCSRFAYYDRTSVPLPLTILFFPSRNHSRPGQGAALILTAIMLERLSGKRAVTCSASTRHLTPH